MRGHCDYVNEHSVYIKWAGNLFWVAESLLLPQQELGSMLLVNWLAATTFDLFQSYHVKYSAVLLSNFPLPTLKCKVILKIKQSECRLLSTCNCSGLEPHTNVEFSELSWRDFNMILRKVWRIQFKFFYRRSFWIHSNGSQSCVIVEDFNTSIL